MLNKQFWAVIPAAGVGKRMQADRPKQYLPLHNKTVIEHTLDRLLSLDEITGVVLSISEGDEYWPELEYTTDKPLLIARGGKERCDSVLNALSLLNANTDLTKNIWVLVHDAARPCVRPEDIQHLIETASSKDDGGLLALPVRDTMKRSSNNECSQVEVTVEREGLWHALTPQMFDLKLLMNALTGAQQKKLSVTDDASAMELAGYHPQLVEAHEDNIKITRAFDLKLAELFLQNQSD
ncbi:MAG: 2-C-methyl-D-erythritol 4-phosphate cytidylyltransferase [endosymbiont of Galathealinum brachiosum]|uniref:2-C-methyl-D-erythritol 4-phosphate cytidylyltransferase n=1 Tax=endosymbiont of Galathealinum brachiosum TaxID=2200906 RepID=A0A370DG55_9GAMM|nr:MAG: 2-C-methyl-D-erythritol 4-phosphate cytidylyltransferase [endosymbiont of Galathealinum brachiosum]